MDSWDVKVGPALRRRDLLGAVGHAILGRSALGGVGAASAVALIRSANGAEELKASARDFIGSQADRDAVAAGVYEGDLTGVLHGALDQIQTAGGGVLYLPRGLYPCNIVLGHGGRTNVNLQGEARGATRLRSFAAGGFAVQDVVTDEDGGWAPLYTLRRSISDITFLGDSLTRCGLLIASKHGTETTNLLFYECQIGMLVCDTYYGLHIRPMARACDVGLWFGSVSGTLTNPDITLPAHLAGRPGPHTGNQLVLEPLMHINRVGMVVFNHSATGSPLLKVEGGAAEGNELALFVPNDSSGNIAFQLRNPLEGLFVTRLWLEANGNAGGTMTINGQSGVKRGDLHLGAGVLNMDACWLERFAVAEGGMLYGDNMVWNQSGVGGAFMDGDWGSILFDRAVGAAGDSGMIGPIVKRLIPWRERFAASSFVPPKGIFGRHLNVMRSDRCDGSGFATGISAWQPERWTFQVADGPIATSCFQAVAPTGNTVLAAAHTPTPGKAYVMLVAIKPIGRGIIFQTFGTDAMAGNKWVPPDRWSFVAFASVAHPDTTGNEIQFGVNNQTSSTIEVRFGGIALLEFDRKEEAAEVCAWALFPVR